MPLSVTQCIKLPSTVTLMTWLHVKYNYFQIILKLFQCYISHVTTA